jgi:DNA invertase Pin-like site-specific DNA recombinase
MLKARGVTLIAASAPPHFVEDTPTAVLVRQVLGAVAEFEKATLVAKLAAARRRKRIATAKKVEGRKSHAEKRPEIVALAKALARRVEMWRGDVRLSMSVPAPFVWRCLSGSAVAPFPHPAHRTGHADFPHPALGQDLTPSFACDAIGSF